ncbi:MAG TPA: hypothetical protein VF158_03530 [Longimicrobiales bacterium]
MSAVDAAVHWLERRRPEPPPALRERMVEAVRAVGAPAAGDAGVPPVAGLLGAAALDRLRAVLAAPGGRAAALDLLAADALLTYACEAAAESGPAALEAAARAFGPARLESLASDQP